MTQEQKELLLKDLCERQMYDVKCKVFDDTNPYTLSGVLHNKPYSQLYFEELDWKECDGFVGVEYCKPYLFPLSSMTEEQKKELNKLSEKECYIIEDVVNNPTPSNVGFPVVVYYMVDWCNKNHFDYRGLIPMGLANDATGLNIY